MNKEKLLELSDTLRGIAEGKEWEYRLNSNKDEWLPSQTGYDPVYFAASGNLRLKPQPSPQDPYAELKAAHAAGKTIQNASFDKSGWFDTPYPRWTAPVDMYRIKPEPRKVPLGPDDISPGSVIRIIGNDEFEADLDGEWSSVLNTDKKKGVVVSAFNEHCEPYLEVFGWDELMEVAQIKRSTDSVFQPCYKLIEE